MEGRTQLDSTPVEDFENGDYLMATKILNSRIRHDPNNYELYFERSICHHKLGNYQASLEDANAAIRLNPTDHNVHYQKSLALIRLFMFDDALSSALKAIELRAGRAGTKMSHIFNLFKGFSEEMKIVRKQSGETGHQDQERVSAFGETTTVPATSSCSKNSKYGNRSGNIGEPVDSTTDRLVSRHSPQSSGSNSNIERASNHNHNTNNNLVMTHCNIINENNSNYNCNMSNLNNQSAACATDDMVLNIGRRANRVSSSALRSNVISHGSHHVSPSCIDQNTGDILDMDASVHHGIELDQYKSSSPSSFDWNIRRSERIFLHTTNEPGAPPAGEKCNSINNAKYSAVRASSNPSSVNSASKTIRLTHKSENINDQTSVIESRDRTNNSDIDVEDTTAEQRSQILVKENSNLNANIHRKRVIVAPSSSMSATSQPAAQSTNNTKDDSYSSKYKRLRRDRERARRGTSKLCTIKLADLDELHKRGGEKKSMRVIAPIDGWLYSGQLSLDDGQSEEANRGLPHFVVKLDGDSSGSSYLFTQDTVLNDVIKEVRVKSVSDLRKGARICCYWSRTYKCLSTGVVTSRTFEATKSLVSVKYDNGDLSALPLEDLRLLPPDYPKYMSNCDPLLLARASGEGAAPLPSRQANNPSGTATVLINGNNSQTDDSTQEALPNANLVGSSHMDLTPPDDNDTELSSDEPRKLEIDDSHVSFQPIDHDDTDDDDAIPPTNQAIDFITNEDLGSDSDHADAIHGPYSSNERLLVETKDEAVPVSGASDTNGDRASTEENTFGVEYKPWTFEGAPKRSKRHGRTYRDNYMSIRRGNEILRVGDSAELMPRDASILPFIAKIDGLWSTGRGEMRVRVRWYYRLVETEGEPSDLEDGENALFETDHFDENDVQSIWRSARILSWTDYKKNHFGHINKQNEGPKIFYLAGYYDPVRRIKHLRSNIQEIQ